MQKPWNFLYILNEFSNTLKKTFLKRLRQVKTPLKAVGKYIKNTLFTLFKTYFTKQVKNSFQKKLKNTFKTVLDLARVVLHLHRENRLIHYKSSMKT